MSTSSSSRTPKAPSHPGRTLAIMALVLIALLSAVFITSATSVRLGLDLRGGTSVTLQPRLAAGENGKVTNAAIDQAVSIIRQRVNL
jgi:preprotein translocase subunit SecD